MNDGKSPLASKTLWFNALTLAASIVALFAASPLVAEYPKVTLALTAAAAFINGLLRFVTEVPIQLPEK